LNVLNELCADPTVTPEEFRTNEVVMGAGDLAVKLIGRELESRTAFDLDSYFLGQLANTVDTSNTVTVVTWPLILEDLWTVLRSIETGARSKPYFVMTSRMAKALARFATENAVESVGPQGGSILGVPILVSDAQSSAVLTCFDATGIAFGEDPVEVRTTNQRLSICRIPPRKTR
jgi:hypothetical protein